MPRRPRILLPDHPLHIVQRGINREPCFFAEEDYPCYLHWLEEAAHDCGCTIHAYVLMTNHVHLLLTPTTTGAPARLMQSLGRRYVQYANRYYRRTGSLWEGRPRRGSNPLHINAGSASPEGTSFGASVNPCRRRAARMVLSVSFRLPMLWSAVQTAPGFRRNSSPYLNTAQASRAFLAAMATTAFQ